MAHHIFFYPVGNGDTSQIVLENGRRILFDFRHLKKAEDGEGPEIDLQARLRRELESAKRDSFDVVAFTHGDKDHIENSTEFFELLHAEKYQGTGRIKIDTLWVPAAMILETATNDQQSSEFVLWRQEARYRLKKGEGIRVFSKPDKLKDWLKENDLTLESRRHLITDAGETVPEFTVDRDEVEFFCHSPFIKHVDEGEELRNEAALIFNVRFSRGSRTYDYLAIGDSKWDVLEDLVRTTNRYGNSDRLAWDLFSIPHHCSYLALSDEKGETETTPKPLVKELLEHGKEGAFMVSSSEPIRDTAESRNQIQPPHIQAKKSYRRHLAEAGGAQLFVTMEEPNARKPQAIDFRVDDDGITFLSAAVAPAIAITSTPARRAG